MRTTNGSVVRLHLLAIGLLSSLALIGAGLFAGAVSASTALCTGDTVLEFEGVRLLNVDGERTAGPFAIQLEPGIYRVEAASFDAHGPDQVSQPAEQWAIHADSGWVSPFTNDIPDDVQVSFSAFDEQTITIAVSSITLHHRGEGGVNSVDPICVGFARVDSPDEPGADDGDGDDEGDDADVGDGTEEPGADGGDGDDGDGDGDGDGDDGDGDDGDGDGDGDDGDGDGDGDDGDDDGDGDGDGDGDDGDGADVGDGDEEPGANGTDGDEDVAAGGDDGDDGADDAAGDGDTTTEVAGKVETVDALARTGATPLTYRILGLALVLLGLGGLMSLRARRTEFGLF